MYNKKGVADIVTLVVIVLAIVSATFFVKDNLKGAVEAAQPTEPPPKLDLIPPRISFAPQAPPSGYFTNEKTLYFNWTYEERNLANITVYIKEEDAITLNKTTFYVPTYDFNYTPRNYNKMYSYSVNIIDLANEGNDTETRLMTFDRVIPQINFESQTQPNNSYTNQNKVYLKWAFTETNFANITVIIADSTSILNKTTFYTPTYDFTFYPTNLNTAYYYNLTMVDKATNSNSTETRTIVLDSILPTISFTNKTLLNLSNISSDLFFEAITSDTNLANITFNILDSTQFLINNEPTAVLYQEVYPIAEGITSIVKGLNYSLLSEGVYYYNITVIDKANNKATTGLRTVNVDLKAPQVYLVLNNLTVITAADMMLLYKLSDLLVTNCTVSINNTLNATSAFIARDRVPIASTSLVSSITLKNVENGDYFWNVSCTDYFNRRNTSITNKMTVREYFKLLGTPIFFVIPNASASPIFYSGSYSGDRGWPSSGYTLMPNVTKISNGTLVGLNLFASNSTFAFQVCTTFINGTLNMPSKVEFWTSYVFDLANGNYLINASCRDNIYNLTYWTPNYIIIVNYSKFIPNIISLTPNGTIITINSTAALTLQYQNVSASISNCTIIMNSTLNYTRYSYVGISNIVYNPFVITNLANGNYLWNATCTDTSNNKYYSYTYLLTMAVPQEYPIPPLLSLIPNGTISLTPNGTINLFIGPPTNAQECTVVVNSTLNRTKSGTKFQFDLTTGGLFLECYLH
ncbi:hypothetical protein HYX19_01550 [Candidatus Woesearchaeota archaeon]|nr:hypothetical protein [Candidatus Woesearchaeota archaeon]